MMLPGGRTSPAGTRADAVSAPVPAGKHRCCKRVHQIDTGPDPPTMASIRAGHRSFQAEPVWATAELLSVSEPEITVMSRCGGKARSGDGDASVEASAAALVEQGEGRIALPFASHENATGRGDLATDDRVVTGNRTCHQLGVALPQRHRVHDVRQYERTRVPTPATGRHHHILAATSNLNCRCSNPARRINEVRTLEFRRS
jgi:hypothetical protein